MKKVALFIILPLAIISCEKFDFKKDKNCDKDNYSICEDDRFNNPDVVPEGVEIYEIEPTKRDIDGCIMEAYLKYLQNGKTIALVKISTKNGTTYGYKTFCEDGKCDEKGDDWCEFSPECDR